MSKLIGMGAKPKETDELKELEKENKALEKENKSLKKEVKDLKAELEKELTAEVEQDKKGE